MIVAAAWDIPLTIYGRWLHERCPDDWEFAWGEEGDDEWMDATIHLYGDAPVAAFRAFVATTPNALVPGAVFAPLGDAA